MKIALISTMATNIGDELIRRGIQRMIRAALPGAAPVWHVVNKHDPLSVYPSLRNASPLVSRLPRGQQAATRLLSDAARVTGRDSVFDGSDLVVQCGTPIMWNGVHRAEWQKPVWEDALRPSRRPPVLNLSGGSCFPWTASRPPVLPPADAAALRTIFRTSDLLTVRDELAADVATAMGASPTVFPCAALHAGDGLWAPADADRLLVNVMPRGGHFTWGQDLSADRWIAAVDRVLAVRGKQDPVLLLCHSISELDFARTRWPQIEAVLPRTPEEYLEIARTGRVGLVNRMHAGVALASVGVPALAIGTDTRLLMVRSCGQEIDYLGSVSADSMLAVLNQLDDERDARRAALQELEEGSFRRHSALVGDAVAAEVGSWAVA